MPIVRIEMVEGREPARKAELVRRMTEVVSETLDLKPEQIWVVVSEYPAENWGIAGELVAERRARAVERAKTDGDA